MPPLSLLTLNGILIIPQKAYPLPLTLLNSRAISISALHDGKCPEALQRTCDIIEFLLPIELHVEYPIRCPISLSKIQPSLSSAPAVTSIKGRTHLRTIMTNR